MKSQHPSLHTATLFAYLLVAVVGTLAVLFPLHLIGSAQLQDLYQGPEAIILENPNLIFFYTILSVTLIAAYSYIVSITKDDATSVASLKRIVLCTILIFLLGVFTYPTVFDPLYYFLASKAWFSGLNPYTDLLSHTANLKEIHIPVYHNYIYGVVWFVLTSGLTFVSSQSYVVFSLLLKLSSFTLFLYSILIAHLLNPKKSLLYLLLILGLNPIYLLYVVPSGLMEYFQIFLLLFSLYALSKQRVLLAIFLLLTNIAIKISVLPVCLFLLLYALRVYTKGTFRAASVTKFIFITGIFTGGFFLLEYALFGQFTFVSQIINIYTQQTIGPIRLESIPGTITTFFSVFLPAGTGTTIIFNVVKYLLISIFGLIFLYYVLRILSRKELTLPYVLSAVWVIVSLTPFMVSSAPVRPWYLLPSLVFATLLSKRYVTVSVLATITSTIAAIYMRFFYFFDTETKLVILLLTGLLAGTLPLLLYMSLLSPSVANQLDATPSRLKAFFFPTSSSKKNHAP